MIRKPLTEFLRLESASGILLLVSLVIVLVIANSPLNTIYQNFLHIPIQFRVSTLNIDKPLQLWVNKGLMAIFFMLLALEIKREVTVGQLSSPARLVFPIMSAVGGIVLPVIIYFLVLGKHTQGLNGWAIPTTTDIALVLGLMALLGKRIPPNLKVFLIAVSIVDDVIAVILIAAFYSKNLSFAPLVLAAIGVAALIVLNIKGVKRIAPYILIGIFIWLAVFQSGIHATLAGILVGFCIPLKGKNENSRSPLKHLEHILHPWVAYLIMPLFVFCNAGIPFHSQGPVSLFSHVPIAIALGLFLGKQLGIFSMAFIAVKMGITKLPKGVGWAHIYGVATLSGIGFTMSLFIAALAFEATPFENISRQGILIGSFLSAVLGILILYCAGRNVNHEEK